MISILHAEPWFITLPHIPVSLLHHFGGQSVAIFGISFRQFYPVFYISYPVCPAGDCQGEFTVPSPLHRQNEFKMQRCKTALPVFKSGHVTSSDAGNSLASYAKPQKSSSLNTSLRSANTTFHHHSELPSGLIPAARSSAIHQTFSASRSANESSCSRSGVGSMPGNTQIWLCTYNLCSNIWHWISVIYAFKSMAI